MLSILAPLIMQVGIGTMATPVSPVPPELENRMRRNTQLPGRAETQPAIASCLSLADRDPDRARDFASEWVSRTDGEQRAAGRHCLGVAQGNAGAWGDAAASFLAARDEGPAGAFAARMGALAGSAFLAEGRAADALAALDRAEAAAAGDAELTGGIAMDRATALVALGRPDEASAALAAAREEVPGNAHAWLLSATLARRQGDLVAAQGFVERAAAIDARDPEIGLEAGVIAALGGRDDAARRSFESVLLAAPEGPLADAATTYLEQLAR
ncbi:tetratricopeptide repeat protein [Tsuneonella amylolytica]|uniref:tetratricopeptide repeat protein n=1 Tax=Tsuneonella amylolytica TaxID=2338327 RepID=UPI000EAA914E|nr:tetratricopeptide repeat protein [Tsuneonella amylolytica]